MSTKAYGRKIGGKAWKKEGFCSDLGVIDFLPNEPCMRACVACVCYLMHIAIPISSFLHSLYLTVILPVWTYLALVLLQYLFYDKDKLGSAGKRDGLE